MVGKLNESSLHIDTWLKPMGAASDRIYLEINKSDSLFAQYDPKIDNIYTSWIKQPSCTIGDANVSEDEKVKQKFCSEMNEATRQAVSKLDELYANLMAALEKQEAQKQEKSLNNNTDNNSIFANNENINYDNSPDNKNLLFDFTSA